MLERGLGGHGLMPAITNVVSERAAHIAVKRPATIGTAGSSIMFSVADVR